MPELTDEQLHDIQVGFAADHVRKGFWDQNDLDLLGITEEEAQAVDRERRVEMLAQHSPDDLRAALALAEGKHRA
jgi:hypothetical protein